MSDRIPPDDLASFVTLSPLFSDNMVLQRGKPVVLFGIAEQNKKFNITINENESIISSGNDGMWIASFEALIPGGPYEINLQFKEEIVLSNIVCGDVYLCSGQSNMEMQLDGWGRVNNFRDEIANTNSDNIRLLQVDYSTSLNEQANVKTSGWKVCSSESVAGFSAVAYFFAKNLVEDVDIPIGLIQSTWPGSPIEAWMSRESLSQFKEIKLALNKLNADANVEEALVESFTKEFKNWEQEIADQEPDDINGDWQDRYDWHPINLSYLWQENDFPEFSGSVWFRKNFELPINNSHKDYVLRLGPVKDSYTLWINGKLIKKVSPIDFIREHNIPPKILRQGTNEIVMRVFAEQYGGGFWGEEDEIEIFNSNFSLALSTNWYVAKGVDLTRISVKPKNPTDIDVPSVLFNAMINPLTKINIKGILWYQGESNVDEAEKYERYFSEMISNWRKRFNDENIPFLFVQLANYNDENDETDEQWARLREAQEGALDLENTGMICSIDSGEADDIHPRNKQEIGRRLTLLALKMIYNKDVICYGPKYNKYEIENDSVIIYWDITGDSLKTSDGIQPKEFMIASDNKSFFEANTVIDKNKTILTCNEVTNPVAIRYAWTNNPLCNLTDESGLPALPFRTDSW